MLADFRDAAPAAATWNATESVFPVSHLHEILLGHSNARLRAMAHDDAVARKMADLFDPEPQTWGLRGDPYLWRALRERLSETDMPGSAEEAVGVLHAAFGELTGLNLASETASSAYLAQYAHGGMSSGTISVDAWRQRLIPMLADRARTTLYGRPG